jgi:nucleolar protein 56
MHFAKFVSLSSEEASRSQLGLGHAYSRSKVKFNVNRVDNMIIQSIALIDQIDKDLNTFAMRCREWYSWHFPELYAIVQDNVLFAKLVVAIQDKAQITPEKVDKISVVVNGDANMSEAILHAAKHSMGMEIAEVCFLFACGCVRFKSACKKGGFDHCGEFCRTGFFACCVSSSAARLFER